MDNSRFAFLCPHLGDLGATYDDHLSSLIGKRVVDFLLVLNLIELFSLGVTADERLSVQNRRFRSKSNGGRLTQNFRQKGSFLTNHSFSQKTWLNDISCGIKIWTDFSSVFSQFTRLTDRQTNGQTDRQTDRILIARPRLHSMQRRKNMRFP